MSAGAASPGRGGDALLARVMRLAEESYDPACARRAGGRARFDYEACRVHGAGASGLALDRAGAAALADLDDIHWPALIHPGAIIWAALDQCGASGDKLWLAAHMGYDVAVRLGIALGAEHRRYWHATATAGGVGAAVAAAVALGSDPVAAAAHAVSLAGGSIVCILEYTDTRLVHRDHAAALGVRCARLAALSAAPDSLEHPRGMFAAMGGSPEALLSARTKTALEEVSFRRHHTSGFNQAAVEAAQELATAAEAAEPTSIDLEVPAATADLAACPDPRSLKEAWWSCQHAVAATLLGRDLATCSVEDPDVSRIRGRVQVRVGDGTKLTVDGRTASRIRAAELSDADLIAKWHDLNPAGEPPLELLA